MSHFLVKWTPMFAILLLVGCSSDATTATEHYGQSSGYNGKNSLNGFSALRSAFENAGYDSRDIHRLNKRTSDSTVIVWTPQVLSPIPTDVTHWMEEWLERGGRTLVYIVPDSGSSAKYWKAARAQAPPKQRMEYRRRLARQVVQRTRWQRNRGRISTNGWFELEARPVRSESGLMTEFVLYPRGELTNSANANVTSGATGPNNAVTSYWSTEASETKVNFESLRKSNEEHTILAEITSEDWENSRIIVVAGGSLITNYGFIDPAGVEIANLVVNQSIDSSANKNALGTSGFLTSSYGQIPISDKMAETSLASGMELLTVWPISLVTIHLTLLGFIVCMILFPRFGRARTITADGSSDFNDHLDAVAGLMRKAKGTSFARTRISQYMRRIKGDSAGKWVLPERKPDQSAKSAAGSPKPQPKADETTF